MKKSLIALLLVVALVVTVSVFAVSATEPEIPAQLTSKLTVNGDTATGYCPRCEKNVTWTALRASDSHINVADSDSDTTTCEHRFLADKSGLGKGAIQTTTDGMTLVLHLNGNTHKRNSANGNATGVIRPNSSNTTICIVDDPSGTGVLDGDQGNVINTSTYNKTGNKVFLYSGTLQTNMPTTNKTGSNGGTVNLTGGRVVEFTMYSGTITGTNAGRGGAIYAQGSAAVVNIYGGTITGGDTLYGGAIYVESADLNVSGADTQITGGTASTNGGAISVHGTGAEFNMTGGTITGGSSLCGGSIGLVRLEVVCNISGGTITGGQAPDGNGGNIGGKGQVTISGTANITGGSAYRVPTAEGGQNTNGQGGNIYLDAGSLTMTGGTLTGSATKSTHGGNIFTSGIEVEITGGTITGGKCTSYGGNLYLSNAKTTIEAAEGKTVKITNGTAGAGGNLYIRETAVTTNPYTTITGPDVTISGGDATNSYNSVDANGKNLQCGSQIMLYGASANPCTLTLTDVAIDSTETHTDEIALYEYAELKVGGSKNIDCAYMMDSTSKVIVLPDYTGEMHVRWLDTAIGEAVVPGATVDASLTYDEGYEDTGAIKACNKDRTGKIASTNGEGGFVIANFGGFNYDENGKAVETPLAAMPKVEGAYDFIRSYLEDGSTIELAANTTLDLNNGMFEVVTNGFELKLIESRTNKEFDYEKGYVTVDDESKVQVKTQLPNGYQYIVLGEKTEGEATKFTAHRVQVDIDSVNIKPASGNLYYTTYMDTTLEASQFAVSYGVVLSLADMPAADFINDKNPEGECENLFTEIDFALAQDERVHVVGTNSALLTGILNKNAPEGQNKAWGELPIYANAFICFNIDGEDIYVMADKTYDLSLLDILKIVDGNEALAANASVIRMYQNWEDPMAAWAEEGFLTHIKANAEANA